MSTVGISAYSKLSGGRSPPVEAVEVGGLHRAATMLARLDRLLFRAEAVGGHSGTSPTGGCALLRDKEIAGFGDPGVNVRSEESLETKQGLPDGEEDLLGSSSRSAGRPIQAIGKRGARPATIRSNDG